MMAAPDIGLLHRLFEYNKSNGFLYWKTGVNKGKMAGAVSGTTGRRQVKVQGKMYLQHRLIWFIVNNNWPDMIDHIDGNFLNNKIENLRPTNFRDNSCNTSKNRNGGLPGASLHKNSGLWRSYIRQGSRQVSLGYYSTKEEAHAAYLRARLTIN